MDNYIARTDRAIARLDAPGAPLRAREATRARHTAALKAWFTSQQIKYNELNEKRRAMGLPVIDPRKWLCLVAAYANKHGGRLPLNRDAMLRAYKVYVVAVMRRANSGVPMPKGQKICLKVVPSTTAQVVKQEPENE